MLVRTIPVMPCEVLRALDHLSADGAPPVLLSQDLGTKPRRRSSCQVAVTVLKVRLPGRSKGVGVALNREITQRFDRLPNADDLFTADRSGEPPGFPRLMGDIARGDPAPSCVRVAPSGPPIAPSPHE